MSSTVSVSAPSTPTEQERHIHSNVASKKKGKHSRVHFPVDEMLVTCYLEPPDPWSKVYASTINTLVTAYVASCDKQGIKPLTCVLDQLQEFENNAHKLESNPRSFDLSILGEKLSVRHCEALEEVLRRLQFHLIDLEGCYLEDEGAAAFFEMIEYYDSAIHLNISFTKHIDCRGWQACSRMLKKTTSLVHLNARSTGLNEQVLLIVGRALRLGSNLVTLHLENCGIFGRCLVILVAALKLNTTLRELFLAENKISSADGFQLGNLLRTNTHLELLDLSNNKLGDDGLVHLMESLGQQSNTSGRGLSTLSLWNNELTVKGMTCIARALVSARALRRLNLGSNAITTAGILELKDSFICNKTIEVLELENAGITSDAIPPLVEYISQNKFLQKIDLRGNDVRLNALQTLCHALSTNPNIISLKVDSTSMNLSESIKDRQHELQEISKICQKNKEAKSSLPPQDVQLSTLFNGIFSHVLPTSFSPDAQPVQNKEVTDSAPKNSFRGRFRVSVVVLNNQEDKEVIKPPAHTSRSLSLAANFCPLGTERKLKDPTVPYLESEMCSSTNNIVSNRIRWLEDLNLSDIANDDEVHGSSHKEQEIKAKNIDDGEVFLSNEATNITSRQAASELTKHPDLALSLKPSGDHAESEQKVRRLSSPTVSSVPLSSRKTHSIKCCKELEGLDLRSSVPLSPSRLHESFNFPEPDMNEVQLTSQINVKTSHTMYMVH